MHSLDNNRRFRKSTFVAIFLFLLFLFHLQDDYTHITPLYWQTAKLKGQRSWDTETIEPQWLWNYTTDAHNLLLTHRHCGQAFKGLFSKIDQSVRRHHAPSKHIRIEDLDRVAALDGVVRAMIYDGSLYIISTGGPLSSPSFTILTQMHRAITTSSEEIENIEFAFTVDHLPSRKLPQAHQWSLARAPNDFKTWLMPDFGFFGPAETGVKSFHEARKRAEHIDNSLQWQHKQSKLLWRGGTTGISKHSSFLDAASDAPWADVQAFGSSSSEGRTNSAESMLDMDAHCNAKYLAHTQEGNRYSGSLKFLQLCRSVIITEPMKHVTLHSHLLQKDGPDQNYMELEDWHDELESKVRHLQSWDSLGERIARNSIETFRERFLTPAAEACSWRRLFKGWAEVSFTPEFYEAGLDGTKEERGVLFERYMIDMMFD